MHKFLILGLGKTGISAYHFLKKEGKAVVVWDDQEAERQKFSDEVFENFDEIDCVMVSPGVPILWPYTHLIYQEARMRNIPIISDLDYLYQHAKDANFIGITGTNGKSTTTALLGFCLNALGKKVAMGGNLGTPALDLPMLKKDEYYVLEVSSYQLDASVALEFDTSVLLNITPDHLERHGGIAGYIHSKTLIFKNMLKDSSKKAFIGVDNSYTQEIYDYLSPCMKERIVPISSKAPLQFGYYCQGSSLYKNGTCFWDLNHPFLKGQHNMQNILATYAVLESCGFPDLKIQEAILNFRGLEHRQEYIGETPEGLKFVNDSKATNAEATSKALEAYNDIYLILGGKPKDNGIESLSPYFQKLKHVLLIGEAAEAFSKVLKKHGVPYTISKTIDKALDFPFESAGVVLLSPACASFDQFKNFEERGNHFRNKVLEKFDFQKPFRV